MILFTFNTYFLLVWTFSLYESIRFSQLWKKAPEPFSPGSPFPRETLYAALLLYKPSSPFTIPIFFYTQKWQYRNISVVVLQPRTHYMRVCVISSNSWYIWALALCFGLADFPVPHPCLLQCHKALQHEIFPPDISNILQWPKQSLLHMGCWISLLSPEVLYLKM